MKRILVGFIQDGKSGGLDKYLLTFFDAVKSEEVEMDFMTDDDHDELKTFLKQYGSELYPVVSLRHPFRQYKQVCEILKNKHYDMVYLNVSTAIDCIAAFAAKKMRIPVRAIHSHSSGNDRESELQRKVYDFIHNICKRFLYRAGTHYYACSVKAGRWLFPEKIIQSDRFEVIYNAVNRKKFLFNKEIRDEMRKQYEVEDKYVIGHIGNFCYPKNYPFLLDVFECICKRDGDAVLFLIGAGVEYDWVKEIVKNKKLEERVEFLGWRSDTERLYQMMDAFVLPSVFEGLPIVGVEAQSSGLPCVFSDNITKESKIHSECYFLKLNQKPEEWAEFILQFKAAKRQGAQFMEEAKHYDLEEQISQLRGIICH